jgi:hypothetical protein
MNQEFHAYVRAIAGEECGKAKVKRGFMFSKGLKKAISVVTEFLDSIGPYYCDLRPMRRVRGAIERCCKPKEVIGFHGLA